MDEGNRNAVMRMAGAVFGSGSMTRGDLLEAAVAARGPASVIEVLLRLPDRRYNDLYDLRAQLGMVDRSGQRNASPRK
jgi:hypothetical protein